MGAGNAKFFNASMLRSRHGFAGIIPWCITVFRICQPRIGTFSVPVSRNASSRETELLAAGAHPISTGEPPRLTPPAGSYRE